MENYGLNLNKIKQPEPNIQASDNTQKRTIKNPYVGIISNINPTSTPISDTLVLKEQENPRIRYKLTINKNHLINFDNIATGGIITCGVLAVLSLIKKIRKK